MVKGPFDISVEREGQGEDFCYLFGREICNVRFGDVQIETTYTDQPGYADEWVRYMQRIHSKRRGPLVAGICFFRKLPEPEYIWPKRRRDRTDNVQVSKPSNPIGVIAVCLGGTHCLLYRYEDRPPGSLKAFLADRRISFVGVEVERDGAKLEKEWGMVVGNPVELKPLVAKAFGRESVWFRRGMVGGYGLEDMAETALDGMKVGRKPEDVAKTSWDVYEQITDGQVMHASTDAFLSFEVGIKCLEITGSKV